MNPNLHPLHHDRRRCLRLAGLAGLLTAALGLPGGPALAADPLRADVKASSTGREKVRAAVRASISRPGLSWTGSLGEWDVPRGGQRREVAAGPNGLRFAIYMKHLREQDQVLVEVGLLEPAQQRPDQKIIVQAPVL